MHKHNIFGLVNNINKHLGPCLSPFLGVRSSSFLGSCQVNIILNKLTFDGLRSEKKAIWLAILFKICCVYHCFIYKQSNTDKSSSFLGEKNRNTYSFP